MITLRLDPVLEHQVTMTAKNLGITRSEFIRESLADSVQKQQTHTAWETGKDLFGKYASGQNDLSSNRKQLLKKKIRAKNNA